METITGIKNHAADLTELECAVVEAQAFDRYKRYLKAAKEVDKAFRVLTKNIEAENLTDEQYESHHHYFDSQVELIAKKHELPNVMHFFGEEIDAYGCVVTKLHGLSFQVFKKWITAAAYGRMSVFQLNTLLSECLEFDYMDPYWVILGIAYYYSYNCVSEEMSAIGGAEGMEKTLLALCTRNANKARPLPELGYSFWGHTGIVDPDESDYLKRLWNARMEDSKARGDTESIQMLNRNKHEYLNRKTPCTAPVFHTHFVKPSNRNPEEEIA